MSPPSIMHTEITHSTKSIALWVIALCFTFIVTRALSNRIALLRKPLPPGPSFITRWKARHTLAFQYLHWSKLYGEVMSVMDSFHLGQATIVLSTPKAANDLLEKRGNIYSSRPRNVVAGEICYRGLRGGFQQTGTQLRNFRTVMNATMNANASKSIRPLENAESKLLLRDLLEAGPEKYKVHVLRAVHSVAFYSAYGLRIDQLVPSHIEFYGTLEKFFRENILPGKYLVDHFPVLLHLPHQLQWFRREADRQGAREERFFLHCLSQTKTVLEQGRSPDASAAHALERQDSYGWSDLKVAVTSSAPYTAGVMTTYGSFVVFTLAMLLYPEVMKQAQRDIDAIVGRNRLPGFEDFELLPYIQAMIKELGRWHPPAPLALPHAVTRDDVYEGMFIPVGSTVIANVYAITRNTEFFPDPEEFKPERFLNNSDPFFKNYNATFGFGRRICPGQHIASDQLFILITRVLWTFDIISQEKDFDPLKHRAPAKPRFGMVSPLPYKLIPRAETVRSIVLEEGLLAEKEVQAWENFIY